MAHDGRVREPRPSYNHPPILNTVWKLSSAVFNQTQYVEKSKAEEKDEHMLCLVCVISVLKTR